MVSHIPLSCPAPEFPFDHLPTDAKLIEIVRPPLGHPDPLRPMRPAVVGGPDPVLLAMGKGALDRVRVPEPDSLSKVLAIARKPWLVIWS